ncbi:MAG: hypothetical protein V7765_09695 [Oleispira sp.]
MIKVYLANRPPLEDYLNVDVLDRLQSGEIKRIGTETGNHWRKIFNVYAKLIYCLAEKTHHPLLQQHIRWQDYRDQTLLQQGSGTELHLASSSISSSSVITDKWIHIVMGKSFSEGILEGTALEWLDKDFAVNRPQKIIVCPYFDYRQLSNIKIQSLAELIISLRS